MVFLGSVYAVSERLKTLYKMQMESKPECLWRIYLAQNKIKRQLEEAEKIRQQKYEARIKELELETESGKKKAKAKLDRIKKKYDEAGSIVTPETVKLKIIEDEIVQAEEVLRKLYSVLNAMYECGVIFVKYRNIVACSSFSEYLESGRCTRLDGADGAYNIYESETRMNMVISELSQIVESLEQIKQNQFVIYSAIKETNRLLNSIDNSMSEAISTLSDIKADMTSMNNYMKEIANNTAVSAYYSRVNAFYAKKNAELTNALGFMVAFK